MNKGTRKKKVIQTLLGEQELEYLAVKADGSLADNLNARFSEGWHIWQTFSFPPSLGLMGSEASNVVILERPKRG